MYVVYLYYYSDLKVLKTLRSGFLYFPASFRHSPSRFKRLGEFHKLSESVCKTLTGHSDSVRFSTEKASLT
jgi:hypothetical protein